MQEERQQQHQRQPFQVAASHIQPQSLQSNSTRHQQNPPSSSYKSSAVIKSEHQYSNAKINKGTHHGQSVNSSIECDRQDLNGQANHHTDNRGGPKCSSDMDPTSKDEEKRVMKKSKSAHNGIPRINKKKRITDVEKSVKISHYDRLEEARFKSFEATDTLRQLVSFINRQGQSSKLSNGYHQNDSFVTLSTQSWIEIKKLANDAAEMQTQLNTEWNEIVDYLNQETNRYRAQCLQMKSKIQTFRQDRISLQRNHESTLRNIASAYNQNRTQFFTVMDDMELAVHELKHGIEKKKVKQMSHLTQLNKDMDEALSEQAYGTYSDINLHTSINASSGNQVSNNHLNENQRGYVQQTEEKVITPRSQQLSARRGRSQQPQQKEQNREFLPPQYPGNNFIGDGESKKINIPLLPIHMINNKDNIINSGRGQQQQPSYRNGQALPSHRQLSSRRHTNLPPQYPGQPQISSRGGNVSQRSNQYNSYNPQQSARGSSCAHSNRQGQESRRSNQGGIIDGEYLVNPVFLGAVYQTSQFDKNLEDDFDGAEQTMPIDTGRLQQYTEEYELLQKLDNEDQRILFKQWLFMNHERSLKKQVKREKLARIEQKRLQKQERAQQRLLQQQHQPQSSLDGTTPRGHLSQRRNANGDENEQTLKEPSVDNLGVNVRRASQNSENKDNSFLNNSQYSLQRALSQLGTVQLISARRKEQVNDVDLNQLLDVSSEISGLLKSATQKSIIERLEKQLEEKNKLYLEDRKVLEWSSHEEGQTDQEESYISINASVKNDQKKSVNTSRDSKQKCSPYQIENPKQGGKVPRGSIFQVQPINVGEMSPLLAELREESHFEKSKNIENQNIIESAQIDSANQNVYRQKYDRYQEELSYLKQLQESNDQNLYQLNQNQQQIPLDQLEIIQERQSEFSSSINTNNRHASRLSSHRNSKPTLSNGGNNFMMMIPPHSGRRNSQNEQRVLSARENSNAYCNYVDFNRPFLLQPSINPLFAMKKEEEQPQMLQMSVDHSESQKEEQKQLKRSKSQKSNLQNPCYSQRDAHSIYSNQKVFSSIPIEESAIRMREQSDFEDNQAVIISKKVKRDGDEAKYQRPITDLDFHREQLLNTFSPSESHEDIHSLREKVSRFDKFAKKPQIIKDQLLYPQHFSSIQNHFDESKSSAFNNESLFYGDDPHHSGHLFDKKPRSVTDFEHLHQSNNHHHPQQELGDLDDNELNQLQNLCFKLMSNGTLLQEGNQSHVEAHKLQQSPFQNNKIQTNSQSLRHHFLLGNQNNVTSSLFLQGNQTNQSGCGLLFPTNTQNPNQSNLLQSRGFTANMITKYLIKNFTQLRNAFGQMTREAPTSGKQGEKKATQIHGQSGFTLSTLGDETLMYMFPAQKTTKKTLFMLQNFHNNYYTNQAGVLFTMPISELNNGFLQQCSTVPSADPDLVQSKTVRNSHKGGKLNQNQSTTSNVIPQIGATQESILIKEESSGLMPRHFYNHDPNRSALSKNGQAAALSTGESGTLKSTVLGMHQQLRFNPQAFQNAQSSAVQEQTMYSPRQSFDNNEKTGNANMNHSDFNISNGLKRASSQNPQSNGVFKRSHVALMKPVKNIGGVQETLQKNPSQGHLNGSIPTKLVNQMFNRNFKINQPSGLVKLQAMANSVQAAGGAQIVIKKPNLIKVNRSAVMQQQKGMSANTSTIEQSMVDLSTSLF